MAAPGKNEYLQAMVPDSVISKDSPIMAMFSDISKKMTERQDRHERLFKLSRDITIESKRIISFLQSSVTKEKSQEDLIADAKKRLEKVINQPIKAIALELEHVPRHLHSRAVTAGFQEFIEALTFCSILENKTIITYYEAQKQLEFTISDDQGTRTVSAYLPRLDYMLGLADLSGELMRNAITNISSGNVENCFFMCQVLRQLYAGFLGLNWSGSQLAGKLNTTRNNVYKVEQAVYTLVLRRNEAKLNKSLVPAPTDLSKDNEIDEGVF